MKKILVVTAILSLFIGCSRYASNSETLYLQSPHDHPLVIPPPLTRANLNDFYYLPAPSGPLIIDAVPPIDSPLV